MIQQITCPHCNNKEVVKQGFKQTEAHGLRQRYLCKQCSKRFIPQDAFFRMRNTPQKVTCALDLFCRGLSTRGVQEHFKAFFPHNSDQEEREFHLQRLYGRDIYFGNDPMKKYEILQQARGVVRLKGNPTLAQLKILISELESQYLFQKQVVEHPY